jgi:hypothetical protein
VFTEVEVGLELDAKLVPPYVREESEKGADTIVPVVDKAVGIELRVDLDPRIA